MFAPAGHLTGERGRRLLDALSRPPWRTTRDVVVDLSELTGLDPAGAVALLDIYVAMTLRTGTLTLVGVSAAAREALADAGGQRLVDVIDAGRAARRTYLRLVRGNRVSRRTR
jgi:anti-anti-sigma regulatory factor